MSFRVVMMKGCGWSRHVLSLRGMERGCYVETLTYFDTVPSVSLGMYVTHRVAAQHGIVL